MERELRSIRDQMQSDFKTIMSGLGVQRDAVAATFQVLFQEMEKIGAALTAQQEILAGFMERTEQRFEAIVTVVEGYQEWRGTVDERLDALERKQAG